MPPSFRQSVSFNSTDSADQITTLPAPPRKGNALILVTATENQAGVAAITQAGADWNLLTENLGSDAEGLRFNVKAQIWGAFNLPTGVAQSATIQYEGGVVDRGGILAEYQDVGFQFPNPADRVEVGMGTTVIAGVGPLNTGVGGMTREAVELWVAMGAIDKDLAFANPLAGWTLRGQNGVGATPTGRVCLLDQIRSSTAALQMTVEHANASSVNWVAIAAAIREDLQVPATAVATPSVSEPLTENEDHGGSAIANLLEQFKSKDQR